MSSVHDPFEAFREKRKLEELTRHVQSNPAVKSPSQAEIDAAGKTTTRKSSAIRPAFDPSRSWIY
jgi:hypothetical protein